MNKAAKKFRLYAVLAIFIVLTALLAIINGVNFTMASEDADMITQMLAERRGAFGANPMNGAEDPQRQQEQMNRNGFGRMGPMGPGSPEMKASVRYFTFAFSKDGQKVETVAFQMSAVTEEEAVSWAAGLLGMQTGWTQGTYRYRVYSNPENDLTYVTVIDQGRELLPCYRILIISAIGDVVCLILSFFALMVVGRKVFSPLEEADRKQKKFISDADKEFRLPLTVINANTELIERRHGPDEQTVSIRRQVKKMNVLVEKLGSMGIFDEGESRPAEVVLSDFLRSSLDSSAERFAAKGIQLEEDISSDITLSADPEAMKRMIDELIDNSLRYSISKAVFSLKREGERIILETSNDAKLPDGTADQVFDRFTKLENSDGSDAPGLGLAYLKDIVKAHNGRVSASVSGGIFTLKIAL